MFDFGFICLFIYISHLQSSSANLFVIDIKNNIQHPLDDNDETTTVRAESPGFDKVLTRVGLCHRSFKSMHGKSCIEDKSIGRKSIRNFPARGSFLSTLYNKMRASFQKKSGSKFSQDYFDIKDLRRDFADDYFDVHTYDRVVNCEELDTCKTQLAKKSRYNKRRPALRSSKSTSESSDDSTREIFLRARKPNRFQIIYNEKGRKKRKPTQTDSDDNDSDSKDSEDYKKEKKKKIVGKHKNLNMNESDESREVKIKFKKVKKYKEVSDNSDDEIKSVSDVDSIEESMESITKPKTKKAKQEFINKKKFIEYKDSDSMEANSDSDRHDQDFESGALSEEITNKPKTQKEITDKKDGYYVYLQGNKLYDINDFRKQRLPYFLPKRIHWNEEDLHRLSYYWFDGPSG